ncbi:MAG: relaxase domain-containing protein [Defluviicoccus sp.]|nr:relaxase domain-containing protein [Defluviicoccus sp.]MDE0277418.1 relaxase domain-containing protein [Defluviicoccus sp.]
MVATVDVAASAEFYVTSLQAHRPPTTYKHPGAEPHGQWWNPDTVFQDARQETEHGKPASAGHFSRIYNGYHPVTGARLTRLSGHPKRCPGYDMTFTADKTISALWAICPSQLRNTIEEIQHAAAVSAIEDIVKPYCAFTRIRLRDRTIRLVPADIMAALFQHGRARSQDPHLHTRSIIFNLARADHDGKLRSLHGYPLFLFQKAAGAAYRAEFAWLLWHRAGIATEPHGKENELIRIPGFPPGLIELWSSRSAQIRQVSAQIAPDKGLSSYGKATLRNKTTNLKAPHLDGEIRHLDWLLDALHYIPDTAAFLRTIVNPSSPLPTSRGQSARAALDDLAERLSRAGRPIHSTALIASTINITRGGFDRQERLLAIDEMLHHPKLTDFLHPPPAFSGKKIGT